MKKKNSKRTQEQVLQSTRARERFEAVRRNASERENHVIDEYRAGKISRRAFVRNGSIVGLSLPVLSFVAACGDDSEPSTTARSTTTTAAPAAAAGPVTVRVGMFNPSTAIDPVLINNDGGVQFLSQFAETLTWSADDGSLRPLLAESWSPNDDSTVWTFKLRPGVTFSDGVPVTAADVVATFEGIAAGNASSALTTARLSPGGTVAVDDSTVQFNLDGPVGSFPYLVSTDNYNAVITPASFWDRYQEGAYERAFIGTGIGTGPFIVDQYTPEGSAVLVPNPNYRDSAKRAVDRVEVTFFADDVAGVAAMLDGRLDVLPRFSPASGAALVGNNDFNVIVTPASTHRQVHFNTVEGIFTDKRVRQAMALSLDRPAIVEGLLDGFGNIGNDHPIAPQFAAFNPDTPTQRVQDLRTANELIDAAGVRGASVELNSYSQGEVPELAQIVQSAAREIGIDLNLAIHESGTYFSDYWLAQIPIGITAYGHRGIPNVFLDAPLRSTGPWNASGPWVNETYDALLDSFAAEADLGSQRELAGQIQTLLNEEVPFVLPYFISNLAATGKGVRGFEQTVMGHTFVDAVSIGG